MARQTWEVLVQDKSKFFDTAKKWVDTLQRFLVAGGKNVKELLTRVPYRLQIVLALGALCCGFLFLAFCRYRLVVQVVPVKSYSGYKRAITAKGLCQKKNTKLFFWKDDKQQALEEALIWGKDKTDNIQAVVGSWLVALQEERVLQKHVRLESVALTESEQEVLVSFDQALFEPDWPIRKKWELVRGFCKTLAQADLGLQSVVFLVNHEVFSDPHLDFMRPVPIGT